MIAVSTVEEAMYEAMCRAATRLPPDINDALDAALAEETDALARQHLQVSLENFRLAQEGEGLLCGDTGFPLYFITAGGDSEIEGGFEALQQAAEAATRRATQDSFLRPTMVDPLTRQNPGDNIGPGMPLVDLSFKGDAGGLDIVAAPKGGGSEIFGTFYRMLFPADGVKGISKFVVDSIVGGCYAGKICPPAIVGVGIGGTADLCMKMAKRAAVLRPVGSKNPDADAAEFEADLTRAMRQTGIGPMGSHGKNAVMAIHVETGVTHTAALPVAVNAQCIVGRRWTAHIEPDGDITYSGEIAAPTTSGGDEV
ncbi:MAG: fumarate hydratase [Armatimonadota bacterium]